MQPPFTSFLPWTLYITTYHPYIHIPPLSPPSYYEHSKLPYLSSFSGMLSTSLMQYLHCYMVPTLDSEAATQSTCSQYAEFLCPSLRSSKLMGPPPSLYLPWYLYATPLPWFWWPTPPFHCPILLLHIHMYPLVSPSQNISATPLTLPW